MWSLTLLSSCLIFADLALESSSPKLWECRRFIEPPADPVAWAPVNEPGFFDFQICDSRDFDFCQNMFRKDAGVISRNYY